VSSLTPELTGRWNKARRFELAWGWLRKIDPVHLITRRFPLERAGEAYRLLHEDPSQDLQVVFTYLNED
jgi:threonine dehydrogenase-like Zn-dependent dehydrogenase